MRPTLLLLVTAFVAGWAAAQDEIQKARNAIAESLPDVAATRIERYLASEKELTVEQQGTASLLLGEAHLRAGEASKALAALAKVPDSFADTRDYWQGLALAHQQDIPAALEKFSGIQPGADTYPLALYNLAELHFTRADWTGAFKALEKLRAHSPDFQSEKLTLLESQLFLVTGEPAKALEVLANQDETSATPAKHLLRGRIELAKGNLKNAAAAFSKAEELSKGGSVQALSRLGLTDALLDGEEPEAALAPLLSLLQSPESPSFLEFLSPRFELLASMATEKEKIANAITEFVSPASLGEDSNYATPEKLFANYYLARFVAPEEADGLLRQVIELSPGSEIANRSRLELARLALENEQSEEAKKILGAIQESNPEHPQAHQAADLFARLEAAEGNREQAKALFEKAALHPDPSFSEQALLNQALLTFHSNPQSPLSAFSSKLQSPESTSILALEKALALAKQDDPEAGEALQGFVRRHPEHPRLDEIRLALIENLLAEPEPNFELIRVQFVSLSEEMNPDLAQKKFQLAHRLGTITNDWSQAVEYGENLLKEFPQLETDPHFLLRLAESRFQDGDYNRSRFLFDEVAKLPEVGDLAELSRLYSAHSNLLIPTREATVEALETLDGIIKRAGPLATRARLLKARTLLKSQGQAKESLQALEGIPGEPGDQPEAALLSALAYRELSADDSESAQKAISIYERLLVDPRTSYPLSNEIHYQLALTYREMGEMEKAIEPCYRVVHFENKPEDENEIEWDYYYRCGFEAIDILLEAKRARAALLLARKLAQTNGPGAEQAKERAEQIQLDNLLWFD